ncbi:UNVERIFIED_CONTAM: hypothetical protein O8I53_07810 [Campylobacter lari]
MNDNLLNCFENEFNNNFQNNLNEYIDEVFKIENVDYNNVIQDKNKYIIKEEIIKRDPNVNNKITFKILSVSSFIFLLITAIFLAISLVINKRFTTLTFVLLAKVIVFFIFLIISIALYINEKRQKTDEIKEVYTQKSFEYERFLRKIKYLKNYFKHGFFETLINKSCDGVVKLDKNLTIQIMNELNSNGNFKSFFKNKKSTITYAQSGTIYNHPFLIFTEKLVITKKKSYSKTINVLEYDENDISHNFECPDDDFDSLLSGDAEPFLENSIEKDIKDFIEYT